MWIEFNPNPLGKRVGDCAVRAVAKALNMNWEDAFIELSIAAFEMADMPSSDAVWGSVLRKNGFTRGSVPDACVDCYTAEDFCNEYFKGTYVLAFGGHVATCIDGKIYDAWDSSREIPQFYWKKEA